MYAQQENSGFSDLAKTLQRRHKSRNGFVSFYSCELNEWIEKPVDSWDYHELRSLLESVFAAEFSENWQIDIYYRLSDVSYQYFKRNMNWPKYEERVTEDRSELLATWLDTDKKAAEIWISNNAEKAAPLVAILPFDVDLSGVSYRCTKTPDLFA